MRHFSSILLSFILAMTASAQVNFTNSISEFTIDFDNTTNNVNNASFQGTGFQTTPNSGQLDGDAWNIIGLSDGDHLFGQNNTTGDFARGNSNGGVGTGGIYSFTTSSNNHALGIQATGSDITPGSITLKINNNKTTSVSQLDVSYNIFYRNDQDRSSSFNFSYSFDNANFTDETSLNFSTPLNRDASPSWVSENRFISINNISIPPGQSFYIRWSSSDIAGSGSRDEIAIDDIILTTSSNTNSCFEPNNQSSNLSFSTITANSISANFSPALADKFLVIQTNTNSLTSNPIDGFSYGNGDQIGNGTVISYSNNSNFTALGLQASTSYYFHVFSANDNCTGGPDYKNINPLMGNTQTAVDPNSSYYDGMSGRTCEDLKTALHQLIDNHNVNSYNSLWTIYLSTDDRLNDNGNQTIVWDMYSDNPTGSENEFSFGTNQCGTYSTEGDCYNREHTLPRSWWGGSTSVPQYSDAFLVIPVDGYINGIRSNNPYGEVQSGTETYVSANGSRLGNSSISIPSYNGRVFEPIDEYKGDLARIYFYIATRYEDVISSWQANNAEADAVLDGSSFQVFEDWTLNMLLTWHQNDPVSTKEIERNNEVFSFQNNRNPFVDHPEYVALIWDNPCSTTPDTEAPTSPTNLVSNNQTTTTIDLTWNNASDNIAVTQYNIYQDGILVGNSSNNSYSVINLDPATSYSFYVNAQDATGNISANSNTINAATNTPVDTEAPTSPTNLVSNNQTTTTIDLTWNNASDNIAVTQYNVYMNNSFLANTSTTDYIVSNLLDDTSYDFYITAEDASGNISAASNSLTVSTLPVTSGPTVIHEGYFESGLDGWIDGGSDCARYSGRHAYEGSYAIRIRDNSGTASSMTSPFFDLSSFNLVEFSFFFKGIGMESGENFIVQYNDGSGWATIANYISGTNFENKIFYEINLNLDAANYTLSSNTQFRIQCDASANNDKVFVDQVIITGSTSSSAYQAASIATIKPIEIKKTENISIEEITTTPVAFASDLAINIYPNPVSHTLHIAIPQDKKNEIVSIIILNAMGQKLQFLNKISDQSIDVSTLNSGQYFISFLYQNGKMKTKKFIKI